MRTYQKRRQNLIELWPTDSMPYICFGLTDAPDSEFCVSEPIGRRILLYGIDRFIEAFDAEDENDKAVYWHDAANWLDSVERTFDDWEEMWYDFNIRVRSIVCSGPNGHVSRDVLESLLRGENPFLRLTTVACAKQLRQSIMQMIAHFAYDYRTGIVVRDMRNGSVVQSALANVILKFEETEDGMGSHSLAEAPSFGWWAIRKVWFPVWKVQRFLWKLSAPKRYAPDGALVTCQNATAAGDEQLVQFSKRSLEYELFQRAVRRKLNEDIFDETVAEAKSLSEELLKS